MRILTTSIDPNRIKHQQVCLETWETFVDEIYIIQPKEQEEVRRHFPYKFIKVECKHPKYYRAAIQDHVDFSRTIDCPTIFTNSDIECCYSTQEAFDADWVHPPENAFQIGIRHDYTDKYVKRVSPGVDVFRFTPDFDIPLYGICIGNPVWDSWIPYYAAVHLLMRLRINPEPVLKHKAHNSTWNKNDLNQNWQMIEQDYGVGRNGIIPVLKKLQSNALSLYPSY